jgi:hypothetical protein
MAVSVLHHDNRGVDEHADGQRQSAERHDVGADVQIVHGDERGQHRNRERQDGDERGTEVEEEGNADEADDDGLGNEVPLQRVDRLIDQPGAVVASHDLNAGRERRRDLLELGFYAVDDIESVHAVAHHHDAAYGLAFSLPVGRAAPLVRPK